jgi:GMP synthase-like glutamine amidotransferase
MPSCLVVQHLEPEGPYAVAEALERVDVELVFCRTYNDDQLPQHIGDFDGLVVMGGPMSATNDAGFASRRQEIGLLAQAVECRIPTLGICLGAQLLAAAVGGQVIAAPDKPEIGWGPVRLTPEARSDPLFRDLPAELTVLHWHGDTYELPPRAVQLASSTAYEQQAFRIGDRAWGLQFHLEVDQVAVEAFLATFGDDLRALSITPDDLRAATSEALAALSGRRDKVLAHFAALLVEGASSSGAGANPAEPAGVTGSASFRPR